MAGNPAFQNSPAFSSNRERAAQADIPGAPAGYPQQGTPWTQQQFPGQGYQAAQGATAYGSAQQLNEQFNRPSATASEMGRLTYEGVILKTVATLGVVALGFVAGMFLTLTAPSSFVFYGSMIVGLVLGLVNAFKREPSPVLIIAYAAFQGVFIGSLSAMLEWGWGLPGIIMQALIGTASVFFMTLLLYSFRVVRATPKLTKIFMIALGGYVLYSLVNFGLQIFGVVTTPFGLGTAEVFGIPLGLILGGLAVLLGAYSLVMDFTAIEQGVERGVDKKYGWSAAFGLTVTIIWLYIEILRIIAILRGNN